VLFELLTVVPHLQTRCRCKGLQISQIALPGCLTHIRTLCTGAIQLIICVVLLLPSTPLQLASLVESLLDKLRFIPQPEAQERYLAGAVGAVLQQAHGRISRMLHQADLFKDFTSETSLLRVSSCSEVAAVIVV
jgi:hypothetical protein